MRWENANPMDIKIPGNQAKILKFIDSLGVEEKFTTSDSKYKVGLNKDAFSCGCLQLYEKGILDRVKATGDPHAN